MRNAYGNRPLDFKKRGIANRGKQSVDQYMYRGMPFKDQDGRIYYATARDIGNYSAGYVAGTAGQGWVASRKAFDALRVFSKVDQVKKLWLANLQKRLVITEVLKYTGKNNTIYREFYNKGVNILGKESLIFLSLSLNRLLI